MKNVSGIHLVRGLLETIEKQPRYPIVIHNNVAFDVLRMS